MSGILYSFRNLGKQPIFTTLDDDYKQRKLDRWYVKNGVDPDRLKFLKEELAEVEREILNTEGQRYS